MRDKVWNFLKAQVTQGLTPHDLALSAALGAMFGVFPLIGTTTLLCVAVGTSLKLNQPTIQAANYLMGLPQLVLLPLFVSAGEWVLDSDPVSLNPKTFMNELWSSPAAFGLHYGWAAIGAVLAWLVFAPFVGALAYAVTRLVLKRVRPS